jgi:anti-sigma B factor antagonist
MRLAEIEVHKELGATIVSLDGELDISAAAPLRDAVNAAVRGEQGPVVVDLRGTTFIDSIGMATLLNAARRLTRQGRRFAVVADNDAVVRPMRITRLDTTFNLAPSLREAFARL